MSDNLALDLDRRDSHLRHLENTVVQLKTIQEIDRQDLRDHKLYTEGRLDKVDKKLDTIIANQNAQDKLLAKIVLIGGIASLVIPPILLILAKTFGLA